MSKFYYYKQGLAENIIKTGEYVNYLPVGTQDAILLKYLQQRAVPFEKAREMWYKLYSKHNGEELNGEYSAVFLGKWNRAKHVRMNAKHECDIYKEEIDWIDSMKLKSVWEKQIAFLFFIEMKLTGHKRIMNLDLMKYYKIIHKERTHIRYEDADIVDAMSEIGMIEHYKEKKYNFYSEDDGDEWIIKEYYNIKYPIHTGEKLITVSNVWEAMSLLDMIVCEKTCPVCGAVVSISPKSKTDLCKNCWENKRREQYRRLKRIARTGTDEILVCKKICALCGKEFEASRRSKTDLCKSCWEKDLAERHSIANKKWYSDKFG